MDNIRQEYDEALKFWDNGYEMTAEKKAEQMNRVCKYCGANVPDGEETCPGCGSREFE